MSSWILNTVKQNCQGAASWVRTILLLKFGKMLFTILVCSYLYLLNISKYHELSFSKCTVIFRSANSELLQWKPSFSVGTVCTSFDAWVGKKFKMISNHGGSVSSPNNQDNLVNLLACHMTNWDLEKCPSTWETKLRWGRPQSTLCPNVN